MNNPFTKHARAVRLLRAMSEDEAREAVREAKPEMHLKYCPGKHPLTRMRLNGAVSKNMDELDGVAADEVYGRKMMDAQDMLKENMEHEAYYERRENDGNK